MTPEGQESISSHSSCDEPVSCEASETVLGSHSQLPDRAVWLRGHGHQARGRGTAVRGLSSGWLVMDVVTTSFNDDAAALGQTLFQALQRDNVAGEEKSKQGPRSAEFLFSPGEDRAEPDV